MRRQIAFTEPVAELPETSPSLTIDFPRTSISTTRARACRCVGRTRTSPTASTSSSNEDRLLGLGAIAEIRAPAVLEYGIEHRLGGPHQMTPDRNQIIDRCTEVEDLFVATGYSGHGFSDGPGDRGDRP